MCFPDFPGMTLSSMLLQHFFQILTQQLLVKKLSSSVRDIPVVRKYQLIYHLQGLVFLHFTIVNNLLDAVVLVVAIAIYDLFLRSDIYFSKLTSQSLSSSTSKLFNMKLISLTACTATFSSLS